MKSFTCYFLYSLNEITGSHLGFFSIPSRLPHKENCQWWGLRFFRDVDDLLKSWHTKGDVLGWYTSIMESVQGHLSSRFTKGLSCQGSNHFTWFDLKNITIKQQLNLKEANPKSVEYYNPINSITCMNIIHRVCTLLSCSNSMTFCDFFLVIFKFSVTIGLAFTSKNFLKHFLC